MTMRTAWMDYVKKIRKKGNRGKSTMSHREALKAAAVTWPKEKAKLIRKQKRDAKKQVAENTPPKTVDSSAVENAAT